MYSDTESNTSGLQIPPCNVVQPNLSLNVQSSNITSLRAGATNMNMLGVKSFTLKYLMFPHVRISSARQLSDWIKEHILKHPKGHILNQYLL